MSRMSNTLFLTSTLLIFHSWAGSTLLERLSGPHMYSSMVSSHTCYTTY